MSTLIATLGTLAGQNLLWAYFIIYIGTIFLGNISAFTSFWIVSRGYLGNWGIPFLLLTIFLADLTGDLLWYSLGITLRDTKFGNWVKNRLPGHTRMEHTLARNTRKILFFSKFMQGATFPVIFLIGWTKTSFRKFIRNSVLSILLWLPVFLGLAYALLSGISPLFAISIFKNLELAFVVALVLFLLLDYGVAKLISFFLDKKDAPGD